MTEFYLPEGFADPIEDEFGLDSDYWSAARDEKLVVQRCTSCSAWQWAPEWMCSSCHSESLKFEEVRPAGSLFAFTRIWHPVNPVLSDSCPYLVAVIQLEDVPSVRMVGNLIGDLLSEPRIGQSCAAVFEHHADFTLVQWRLVES